MSCTLCFFFTAGQQKPYIVVVHPLPPHRPHDWQFTAVHRGSNQDHRHLLVHLVQFSAFARIWQQHCAAAPCTSSLFDTAILSAPCGNLIPSRKHGVRFECEAPSSHFAPRRSTVLVSKHLLSSLASICVVNRQSSCLSLKRSPIIILRTFFQNE